MIYIIYMYVMFMFVYVKEAFLNTEQKISRYRAS